MHGYRCKPPLSLPERLADFKLTCKTEAATERWKEKNDTNREVNLPTTHGQREGSLVRPFMSERQRKNSLPDTRSRGGEGWGEREREMGGWGRVRGNKKEGGGEREGEGGVS